MRRAKRGHITVTRLDQRLPRLATLDRRLREDVHQRDLTEV